jgi:intein-encoded DNA endonuclease-like protein
MILSPKQINLAISLYQSKQSQKQIALYFGCCQTNISNILRKYSTTRIGKNIIYPNINLEFFKHINNEANAYFLGLLFADGCVQIKNNKYSMTLKLKSNDQHIIEQLRNYLSPDSPIKISTKYSYLRICRQEICQQLINLGCVPNKSLILQFPNIPNHLLNHFIRGYMDGDGSIYKNNNNYIWKITSTNQFCQSVKDIINNFGINVSTYTCQSPMTEVIGLRLKSSWLQ